MQNSGPWGLISSQIPCSWLKFSWCKTFFGHFLGFPYDIIIGDNQLFDICVKSICLVTLIPSLSKSKGQDLAPYVRVGQPGSSIGFIGLPGHNDRYTKALGLTLDIGL